MRISSKILLPGSLFLLLAVLITSVIGYVNIAQETNTVMRVTTSNLLHDLSHELIAAEQERVKLHNALDRDYLRIARAIAYAVEHHPDLEISGHMTDMAEELQVDEIHIIDGNGIIISGSVPEFFGFDITSSDQSREFLPMLSDKNFELAQDPAPRGMDGVLFQYIGVPFQDRPGFLQIGVQPSELQEQMDSNSLPAILAGHVHKDGSSVYLLSPESLKVLYHSNPLKAGVDLSGFDFARTMAEEGMGEMEYTYENEKFFASFKLQDEGILVATVPTAAYTGRLVSLRRTLVLTGALSLVILVLLMLFIIRRIVSPLHSVSRSLHEIAAGEADLTQRLETGAQDEIGEVARSFNLFMEKIQLFIAELQNAVVHVKHIDNQLSESTVTTADVTENINSSIQRLEGQLRALNDNISENASAMEQIAVNASSFDRLISTQSSLVEDSTAAIVEMIASLENVGRITSLKMDSIVSLKKIAGDGKQQVNRTSAEFSAVVEKITRIQEMSNTINNIAAQTNLLSMNAAIEAAHAGDSGRGFAVVAEEIRKLAETASTSAGAINELINQITSDVDETSASFSGTLTAFDSVVREIESTVSAFSEIENAVDELRSGGQQIMNSTEEINRVTHEVYQGSTEIHRGIGDSNTALSTIEESSVDVSRSIGDINQKSSAVMEAMNKVKDLGAELSGITGQLAEQFNKFTTR